MKSVMATKATDLAGDLAEDIVQNVWLALTTVKTFDEEKGRPGAYIHCLILTAIRTVRAENARPGNRTRLQKADSSNSVAVSRLVSLDDLDPATGRTLGDNIPASCDGISQAEDVIFSCQTLDLADATAPPAMSGALRLVYQEGIFLARAAERVGVHRTTLQRNLKAWATVNGSVLAA